MKRLLSLLLFASLFCFGSCRDPDMDIDIDGYRYSSVRLGGVETYFNRSNRGSIVYFCSRNCDGMTSDATEDLYCYELAIDVFLPDTMAFEGKRFLLSNPHTRESMLQEWESLLVNPSEGQIIDKPYVYLSLYRCWTIDADDKVFKRFVKPFYGIDGWVEITKLGTNYGAKFECMAVSDNDSECIKVSGFCGK